MDSEVPRKIEKKKGRRAKSPTETLRLIEKTIIMG